MTNRPTRATVDGRAYLDLQNLARRTGRPTDELHQLYSLEGFLARLAVSAYAETLILKGGVLLAAYDTRRPTRDVDLQGSRISNDTADVLQIVKTIAGHQLDDGLAFDAGNATVEAIREEDAYSGARVTVTSRLSVARLSLHVDVSVGDPIWPPPSTVLLPRLLEGHIALRGYPLSMVHAEKLVTALQRGVANTRWRDFADVYLLARRHDIDGAELAAALNQVAAHRQVRLHSLEQVLEGYPPIAQQRWAAWRRKNRLDDRLPLDFAAVIDDVTAFADPILVGAGQARQHTWQANERRWISRR